MKIKRSRKLRFNSSVLKASEYIVWKNRKGKVIKRVDSRQLVIGEIRRKSKRGIFIVGYINFREGKKNIPSAQRYTATQRAIRSSYRKVVLSFERRAGSRRFTIFSRKAIYPQVPAWAVSSINSKIRKHGSTFWSVTVDHTKFGKNLTPEFVFRNQPYSTDQGRMLIAVLIKQALDSAMLRMSPKLNTDAEGKKRRHVRKVKCRVIFRGN